MRWARKSERREISEQKMDDCPEWRSVKPHIAFFYEYWRFRAPIDEITSKGTPRCLFAARAVHCNSYAYPCPSGSSVPINRLTERHSGHLTYFGLELSMVSPDIPLTRIRKAIPCTPLSRKQASVAALYIQDHPLLPSKRFPSRPARVVF